MNTRHSKGMTLVEILVVVVVLAILAAIALPAITGTTTEARDTVFASNLRTATNAFRLFYATNGFHPPDRTPGIVPPGMDTYLKSIKWTQPTAIGGQWDWDYLQFGYTAGVSVYKPSRTDAQMAVIDGMVDDGNLAAGCFRKRTDGYMSVIAP
jgi:type IV pilus assembly protein PilA